MIGTQIGWHFRVLYFGSPAEVMHSQKFGRVKRLAYGGDTLEPPTVKI
jgi:hypothetical protein